MRILITLLLVVACNYTSYSQELQATLRFRDSTSLEGFGYVKGNKIKFRLTGQEDYDTWSDVLVHEIDFYWLRTKQTYRYVDLNNNLTYKLLKVEVEGPYTLYSKSTFIMQQPTEIVIARPSITGSPSSSFIIYDDVTRKRRPRYFLSHARFAKSMEIPKRGGKKRLRKIFSACTDFATRYDDKEFKENTLSEIVDYYNYFCVE